MHPLLVLFSSALMAVMSFIAQTLEVSVPRDAIWVSEHLGLEVRIHVGCAGRDLIEVREGV